MPEPPPISPTIPKRHIETTKLKRISPPYKHRAEPEAPADIQKPSAIWRFLKALFKTIAVLFAAMVIFGLGMGVGSSSCPKQPSDSQQPIDQGGNQPVLNAGQIPDNDDQGSNIGGQGAGLCYNNKDCGDFGAKNCGGSSYVRCGGDNLCHCCLTYRGEMCIDCSRGCSGGTYCEGNACVFQIGGRTTE